MDAARLAPRMRIVTLAGVVGEEDGRLPGRVAAAHEDHLAALHRRCLRARRAVEDARPDATRRGRRPAARGRRRRSPGSRRERQIERPPSRVTVWHSLVRRDRLDAARDDDLGAEALRLLGRPAREVVSGHAVGKAQVVLDPRRGAGLAAGRLALDEQRCAAPRRRRRRPPPSPAGPPPTTTRSYVSLPGSTCSPTAAGELGGADSRGRGRRAQHHRAVGAAARASLEPARAAAKRRRDRPTRSAPVA